MLNKLDFVQNLLEQLPVWDFDAAMRDWWQNPRGGWRLSHVGFDTFEQCELEHWDYAIAKDISAQPSILLTLDRKLKQPYYIKLGKKPQLCFFDSKEAVMYALYGDITRFIVNLKLS